MADFSFWVILSNLLLAARWTVVLSLVAFASGGLVGLALLFLRVSQVPWLEFVTKSYIEFFQGTPLLMQLFLFFFGIALFGIEVSPWMAAWLALTFWTKAFRIAIPPTVGFSVQVVKGTALTSIIGFIEVTKAGTMLNNATFRPFLVYSLVALIYFALCFPLSWCAKILEGRFHVAR